jgi:type II secretory pathway component GspD/PulD (secretin)
MKMHNQALPPMKHYLRFCALSVTFVLAAAAAAADSVILNFPDTDVREILPLYEALTRFKMVRDNFVQGKISVTVAEPVSPEKAIEIIERSLFANGFSIIQVTPDTVEIVGANRSGRSSGVPTISDPALLPTGERLVSFLFQFKNAEARKVADLFTRYLSPPKVYTSFLAVDGANALWVTERTSVIRELITVAGKIDVPAAQKSPAPP